MIYTDEQYENTAHTLSRFRMSLIAAREQETEEKWVHELFVSAMQSQISELEKNLRYYELLKSGEIAVRKPNSLESLPRTLIQARIASGVSQSELAKTLGIEEIKLQRYEALNYVGTSLSTLVKVAQILNVDTTDVFEPKSSQGNFAFMWENTDAIPWEKFPSKEMIRRNWFDHTCESDVIEATKAYFLEVTGEHFGLIFHRKNIRGVNPPNKYALIAWQTRILELACARIEKCKLPEFVLNDRWLPELVALTRREDGPLEAQKLLAHKGIALVVEEHLPGTYLDGAVMLGPTNHPIIGLTLRFDRVDNFWFVLFHELGHLFLHLFGGIRYDFFDGFDDEMTISEDEIERQADEFALNALLPKDQWKHCLSRFALSEKAVRFDAKRLNVDESIVAGRIRKEQGNYRILNELIRSGVREQLQVKKNDS